MYILIHSANHDLKFQLGPTSSHTFCNVFTAYFNPHDHAQICVTRSGLGVVQEGHAHCT